MLLFHTRSGSSGKRWAFLHAAAARVVRRSVMVRSSNKGGTLLENRGRNRWRHGVLASIGGQRFVIGIGIRNHRERTPICAIFPGRIAKPIGGEVQERDRQVGCVRDGRFMADELLANDSPLTLRATTIDERLGLMSSLVIESELVSPFFSSRLFCRSIRLLWYSSWEGCRTRYEYTQ